MTTTHNLNEKYNKRLRQFLALNRLISEAAFTRGPISRSQKRSVAIAWRNLRRVYADIEDIREKLRTMP